jgi:hypothetical protein
MSESEPVAGARPESGPRASAARLLPSVRARRKLLEVTGLPRAYGRHDTPEGIAYRQYLGPLLRHLGLWPLPDYAVDAARSAGIARLSERHLEAELAALQARSGTARRRQEEYRAEARLRKARVSRRLCEKDLARLAKRARPLSLAEEIRQRQNRGLPA